MWTASTLGLHGVPALSNVVIWLNGQKTHLGPLSGDALLQGFDELNQKLLGLDVAIRGVKSVAPKSLVALAAAKAAASSSSTSTSSTPASSTGRTPAPASTATVSPDVSRALNTLNQDITINNLTDVIGALGVLNNATDPKDLDASQEHLLREALRKIIQRNSSLPGRNRRDRTKDVRFMAADMMVKLVQENQHALRNKSHYVRAMNKAKNEAGRAIRGNSRKNHLANAVNIINQISGSVASSTGFSMVANPEFSIDGDKRVFTEKIMGERSNPEADGLVQQVLQENIVPYLETSKGIQTHQVNRNDEDQLSITFGSADKVKTLTVTILEDVNDENARIPYVLTAKEMKW